MEMLAAVSVKWIAIISLAVIGWFACAFYAGGMARNEGMSYHLFWMIGFLTGPLGLAFSLIYFRMTGERYRRERFSVKGTHDIPEMERCPQCGQAVPVSYDCCQFCGEPLSRKGHH